MSNYFIKENYTINNELNTIDDYSGGVYWDERRIYASRFYQYGVYKKALQILKKHNHLKSVLDIGCGTGEKLKIIAKKMPEIKIRGIDQKSAIEYCNSNHTFGEFQVDDFENPSLSLIEKRSLKSDLLICADVIEHLINPDLLLNYIKEMVNEKGIVILSTPERDRLHGGDNFQPKNKNHVREWNFEELAMYISHHGFNIHDHFYQYPIKIGFNNLVKKELVQRFLKGKALKYNQVVIFSLDIP